MIRTAVKATFVVCLALLVAGCTMGGPKVAAPKKTLPEHEAKAPLDQTKEAKMQPEQFMQTVTQHGGRVDFVFGDEGGAPAPTPSCHASTVVEAPDGSLLAAWFGGKEEGNPDVGIWLARFKDGKWAPATRAAKIAEVAHWNPVLFRDPKRGVYLFFKAGADIPQWSTYWMHSADGVTWSEPKELVAGDKGGRGPVKNPPIVLSDGAWLAPASTESKAWKPFADRSEDGGLTWTRSADFMEKGGIQPTFWESSPGHVFGLMRTNKCWIYRTESKDGGRTWSEAVKSSLPNNNSGIDAVRLDDGRVLLVYNPVGIDWGPRTPLTLAVSSDDGVSWSSLAHLEAEKGEYSYPTIVRTAKGVAIVYTWKRERVRCWQVPLEALK